MTTSTLIKDPTTGAFTLSPGAGSAPIGGSPTIGDLGIGGGSVGSGNTAGDPYTKFNQNIASILTQIQSAANAGRQNLSGAKDTLTTEAVGAAGPYDPTAAPSVNLQKQQGTMGAFAPAVTSISTQLQNADAALKDLETTIGAIQSANQPEILSPGQSLVTKGGSTLSSGHQYSPQTNPNTGLLDGFDVNSGTWKSDDTSGFFGNYNGNTDPGYESATSTLASNIKNIVPQVTPDSLDAYIKTHSPKSPITGMMLMSSSSQYQLDPRDILAILTKESDIGVTGEAARGDNNPGGVMYVGQPGATQGNPRPANEGGYYAKFKSLQDGVSAVASSYAAAQKKNQINTPPATEQATSPVGGSFSPEATAKISALPKAYQSYVDAGPLGVAYINNDRVPDNIRQGLQTMASRAGIPYVQAADAGAVKSMITVLGNLDSMQALATKNLGSGILGHVLDSTLGNLNQMVQTKWGNQLGLFNNYRDTAIKAVQALAGGAGSGLRINMGEISANLQNLPTASDSQENALLKVRQLKQLIYTQLSTTFPYAKVKVKNPQGQEGEIPASNLNEAIKEGYSVI